MSVSRRRSRRRRIDGALEDQPIVLDDSSCIDLTSSADESFVDLTSSQTTGANDSSVVVIGTPSDSPPARRRRRQLPPPEAFDDDDLPDVPFHLPLPARPAASSSQVLSPEPVKITCPVCLDDDKAIKQDKRKLASTTCGHVFCDKCIHGAISTSHCCPVCRKRLTLRHVHTLHL